MVWWLKYGGYIDFCYLAFSIKLHDSLFLLKRFLYKFKPFGLIHGKSFPIFPAAHQDDAAGDQSRWQRQETTDLQVSRLTGEENGHQFTMWMWYLQQRGANPSSARLRNLCLHQTCRGHGARSYTVTQGAQGVCHTDSFQGSHWQLCLCITAANSHFFGSCGTLTFSVLDVLAAVQVTAQVRSRAGQAWALWGVMKELMNALLRWAAALPRWQPVKRQWAHAERETSFLIDVDTCRYTTLPSMRRCARKARHLP